MKFSLVIPCYNEAANLPLLVRSCAELAVHPDVEVILVDNGSSDDTPKLLPGLLRGLGHCRNVRVDRNQGYGFGILSGLRAAQGELLGWTHADMQTDCRDALLGLRLFETHGPDIFVKGRREGRPMADVAFTMGMSLFETALLRQPLWDINAQPTLFSRRFFESWTTPPSDFSLDLYAYYEARRQGLPVHRFPVRFGERAHGVSHWNVNFASKMKFIRRTVDFSVKLRRSIDP